MAFKGKPSINKRNREMALRERQKEKAARREQRSSEVKTVTDEEPMLDPHTQQPLTAEEREFREFQNALKERAANELLEAERDSLRNNK